MNELFQRAFIQRTDENSIFFDDGIEAIALYVDEMAFTAHFPLGVTFRNDLKILRKTNFHPLEFVI